MPLPWQIMAATDMEEQAVLSAAVGLPVTPPTHYYAGVSTTRPTKPGGYTEYSGNGYAAVLIPAWVGAGTTHDSNSTVIDSDYTSPIFTVWFTQPTANVVFPNPTAPWWAGGTSVYLILKDAAVGGNVRWWAPIAPATAPSPGNPLTIASNELLIGVAVQDAGETSPENVVGVMAGQTFAKALDRMTGHDPTYAPSWYLGVGWGQYYDDGGSPLSTYTEPGNPAGVGAGYNVAVRGLDSSGGELSFGFNSTRDADYVRKSIGWAGPSIDADGWYVSNNAPIVWTLGDNTVISGSTIPPEPLLGDQLDWTGIVYELGIGGSGSVASGRGGRSGGHAFALWQQSSGGHGGPPPSLVFGGGPVSGLKDDTGDIWGYPYCPTVIIPDPVPSKLVVWYAYVDESEIVSVTPGIYPGTHRVNMPTGYTHHQFWVIYEDTGGGVFTDPVSGDVWDPNRQFFDPSDLAHYPPFVAWGTDFLPDSSHGGFNFYVQEGAFPRFTVATASGPYNDNPRRFVVGDKVQVDTGALKVRLR